jgi:hypothetical protein
MKRFFVIGAFVAAALLAELPSSHAELFSLSGRFQCLEGDIAVCGDARPVAEPHAAPAPVDEPSESLTTVPVATAAPSDAVPVAAPAPIAAPPIDPLQVVAARVQARRPSSNDLAWLTRAARDGNVRAIELLAWCKLNAIGMARDPVEAFLLYGAAGSAALPHARENQRLIFERDLDSEQRQQVLDLANEGVTLARLIVGAR